MITGLAIPNQATSPWSSRLRTRRWPKIADAGGLMALPGIPIYWIVNLASRRVEVYTGPSPDGYERRVDYAPGAVIPLVIDGETVDQFAVADILP